MTRRLPITPDPTLLRSPYVHTSPRHRIRLLLAMTAAAVVTMAGLTTGPAWAADFQRGAQTFASNPVSSVGAAESAFDDNAADWAGGTTETGEGAGQWTATDLSSAGSWSQGGSSGAYSYSYAMRVPPAAGPTPSLALSYSSAAHDGLTSGTNNQASWIGDGWGYSPGFIERSYSGCASELEQDGNNGTDQTGDLCWDGGSPSVTMALGGINTALVLDDDSGVWHAAGDANWHIEKLGTPASATAATSERWKVTGTDGTQYFFAADPATTGSRWTVPVFGNHSGEACYKSGDFKGSRCTQAYRWMLDKVVDLNGNMTRYVYGTETGYYSPAADSTKDAVAFTRSGWLKRIEYGLRSDDPAVSATGRVQLVAGDRCLSDCYDTSGDPKESKWADTPWELNCKAGTGCEQYAPVFFSTKRLTEVQAEVWNTGAGVFDTVDTWKLTHEFKDYGDKSQVVMWLAAIRHTGHVGDGEQSTPAVEFGGTFMPNRVEDGSADPMIQRPRLTSIKNETGGVTTVNYSAPDCGVGDLPTVGESNTQRCYPAKWVPEGTYNAVDAYFHKYVVTSVAETDTTAGADTAWTFYEYSTSGGGTNVLWAWNDSEFTPDDLRTYNQWRGYTQVTTLVGDPADPEPQLRTASRYYRGMDGEPLPGGTERDVTLTSTRGDTVADHEALAGQAWEQITYDNTTVVGSTITRYWTKNTAIRAYDGGELKAWMTGPNQTMARTKLSDTSWQTVRADTTYDARGRVETLSNHGDISTSGDEMCTTTEYVDNTDKWILKAPSRIETVAVTCDQPVSRPDDVLSDVRAYYDGHDFGAVPTYARMTKSETIDGWDAGPKYATLAESTYDSLGREKTATDALGDVTTTAYTPTGAGPVTAVSTTNPLGHIDAVTISPAWGSVTSATSAAGRKTTLTYDALGRATAVWYPGQDAPTEVPNLKFSYTVSDTAPSTTTTETMIWDQSYLTEIKIFDALMRPRQTQAETYGGRLINQSEYNSYGQVVYSSGANFNNDSGPTGDLVRISRSNDVARTEYVYDTAGRVTAEVFVVKDEEQWRTTTAYGGNDDYWQTTVTPPEGASASGTLTDARGLVVEALQYHGNTPAGEPDRTHYTYTPAGLLESVTDPAGQQWSFGYDLRGRQITADDPDTGHTSMTYDDAGQLVTTTANAGTSAETTLSYEYDALGRKTAKWEGAVDGDKLLSEWTYDTASAYGKGALHKSINYVDNQAWTTEYRRYDITGQPTQVLTTLPSAAGSLAGSYYEAFTYHPDGSMKTSVASATAGLTSETMTYGYDAMGQPSRVAGNSSTFGAAQIYVDEALYSPYGQLLQLRLGDPADVGGTSGQAWQTWIYEEGTGRLAEFYFDKDTAGEFDGTNYGIAALSYEYDQAGKITSITDQPVHNADALQPETQCFQYDYLNRLTEAWAQSGADACATTPTEEAVGGPGAYWSSYQYDLSGNRTAETRSTVAGRFTDTYTYETDSHALTSIATTENGADRTNYTYNETGYATSISRAGDLSTLEWNSSGRLKAVKNGEKTTSFYDDAEGNRLARKDPDGSITAWVAGYELHYDATANTKQATRYYTHGGNVIAQRVGIGDILFVAGDHHGTGQWIVNGGTLTATVRRFDPFGNERGLTQGTWPDDRGFIGGIDNTTTGLTTLGAREYDPTTGRFVSVDPIADYANPQQLNGYAYSNNNPVNLSDPSGLCATGPSVDPDTWQGPCAGTGPSTGGSEPSGGPASDPVAVAVSDGDTIWGEQYDGDEGGCVYVLQGAVGVPCDMWEGDLQDLVNEVEEYLYEIGENPDQYTETFDPTQIAWATTDLCHGGSDFNSMVADNCQMEYLETLDDQRMMLDQAWATDAAERNPMAGALIADLSGGILQAGSASFTAPWMKGTIGLRSYFRNSCKSFEAGTLVVMADGTAKPIEEILPGEQVRSIDLESGEATSATVSDTFTTPEQLRNIVNLGFDHDGDGEAESDISSTAGHAFWAIDSSDTSRLLSSGTWMLASELSAGSLIKSVSSGWVQTVEVGQSIESVATHNLAVPNTHNYLVRVGGSDVLTHNCSADSIRSAFGKLAKGDSKYTRLVDSEDEMRAFFDKYVCTCNGAVKNATYKDGTIQEWLLTDGTVVKWKDWSGSGGVTIEFQYGGTGRWRKVHLAP
ncbi:hypothetical protein O1R50_04050 [Glycomyces luteolus]|uniref:Teneurin-like YD-shell domain-containing protein n=1 Tax=Glycomyces luteolus TaxID=2670330 RepID=A0A9X3T2G8_9ACTN|nr:RHS repeat-associated core domain-containing protein [Glycomyces luteolus]MDA1358780.1 hypothetical protein [Glycomyces luteolus]